MNDIYFSMDEVMRPRVVWVFKSIYETSRDVLKDLYVYISFVTLRNSEIKMMSWRRLWIILDCYENHMGVGKNKWHIRSAQFEYK